MNKFRLFIENFLVYGLGGVISKAVPLFMVPIVTRLMPNSTYFGVSDMANTLLSFSSAIAVMGMYDAMYRMFFEKNDENFQKTVCSTAFGFTTMTSTIVFLCMLFFNNKISILFFSDKKYAVVGYITAVATLIGSTNNIIQAPTRMQNKRKIFLVTNVLSPILSYGIAVPLLIAGYYVTAIPIAGLFSSLSLEVIFWILNRKWFSFQLFDKKLLKSLMKIAIPLLPNFLIYWIFNSSDRIMITNLMTIGDSGIYSVGSKLGHASQLIYLAFAGGWQFFAFSTMKEDDQVESNSRIFEYLGVLSFVATAFICAWSYWIFKLLFKPDYLSGYIVAPYLFLAPLLQMLFQVAANQFLVVKKTWPNFFILASGAVVNVLINSYLIPLIGIEGAAVATLMGYIVSDIICVIVLCGMKLMVVSKEFLSAAFAMAIYMLVWRFFFSDLIITGTVVAVFFTGIMFWLYRNDLLKLILVIKNRNAKI